jgi:hypothetical protein
MSTVQRQDSYDSLDSYLFDDDDLLEALTLSSKEVQQARVFRILHLNICFSSFCLSNSVAFFQTSFRATFSVV